MIQKSTLLWMCLAAVAGTALFHTSESVHQASTHLGEIQEKILQEQDNMRVLEAEWSYLNQPERLEKLAAQLPELKPAQAQQMQTADRLPGTEPAVAPAAPEQKPVATPVSAQMKVQQIIHEESVKKSQEKPIVEKSPAASAPENNPQRSFSSVLAGLGVND